MAFITYAAVNTRKYTKSVADFLAANRCAGKYLLGIAEAEAVMGAITVITAFEMWPETGFTASFWVTLTIPVGLVLTLSGFVYYRYRQTRAMTIAQFFETRYSRKFRIFAGILAAWASGLINFAVFPVVGARFFVSFCGFENHFIACGPLSINLTLAAVMLVLIGFALLFTLMGGQIAVRGRPIAAGDKTLRLHGEL